MDSKKYNNTKLVISISKAVVTFFLLVVFVTSGVSGKLVIYLNQYFTNNYVIFLFFIIIMFFAMSILFAPINYYSGFYLEHKYKLSNQTFIKWIIENLKVLLVSLIIGVPILLFFYYSLNKYDSLWWLPFAILLFFVSVVLARIVPTVILPFFYKIKPLENEDLKSRINKLSVDAGIKVENIHTFNMSKNTKKANAAFTGIGKSKRIILGDTLIDNFTNDEIETVIAHELGHYKKKHIIKNIIIGTASSFLTLFLIAELYGLSINYFGFESIKNIAALPLLSVWGMLIGLIQAPITNIISRKYEYEADNYSVKSTNKSNEFCVALNKLNKQNLGDENPHPLVEWYFYSHPSIKKRINAIKNITGIDSIKDSSQAN